MRVGMFVHVLNDRGIARVVGRVSSAMRRAGVDVSVVCIDNALGELEEVPVVALGTGETGKLKSIRAFSRALANGAYDIAFAHGEGPSRDLVLARLLSGSPIPLVLVSHIHRSTHPRRLPWLQDRIASALLPRADLVAGVSPGVVEDLETLSPRLADKTIVLPNPGPDTDVVRIRAEHPWLEDPELEVVISVGHFNPRKGHEVAIEAFGVVHRMRPQTRFLIVGAVDNQPYLRSLLGLTDELGLGDVVRFLHDVEDAVPYVGAADVLVHAASSEAFGLVILEALAMGTPVVAADSPGGAAWILEHGRYGAIVPVGAPQVMADEVLRILSSQQERDEMSRLGRQRAEEFSAETIAALYVEVAERLLQTSPR
jgi:glycosyltransferase involved in cell wall biosynthesis